ncbi:MAG: phosphate acetyltransferase [unclassified Hahellaceae]|nr:phosphate acetyltransferase [Hahellaceae bacterium]|tara:strand:+ start:9438 stop:11633 length:2196 start_codon:yes stop_codon:yes gene_type:complete
MAKVFFIAPVTQHVGLTSVCLGMLRAFDSIGVRVGFFKPFSQDNLRPQGKRRRSDVELTKPGISDESASTDEDMAGSVDRSLIFSRQNLGLTVPEPMPLRHAISMTSRQQTASLMEEMLALYHKMPDDLDVVVVEGLVTAPGDDYSARINVEVARNLDADVILVGTPDGRSASELKEYLHLAARLFSDPADPDVIGCILNKVPLSEPGETGAENSLIGNDVEQTFSDRFHLIAQIPQNEQLLAPRVSDLNDALPASWLNEGHSRQRRLTAVSVCARTLPNLVAGLRPGRLIVTPGDREDVVVAAAFASVSGVPLAGLLLTSGLRPSDATLALCKPAFDAGLPVLCTDIDTYAAAQLLANMNKEVPIDDHDRIEAVVSAVAQHIDVEWLRGRIDLPRKLRLSPAAFRYQLTRRAREAGKTIVLPEGNEPRTIKAAAICEERGIAHCILLGKRDEILNVANAQGVDLSHGVEILDPDEIRDRYIGPMVEQRKHKGLTSQMAEAQLDDNVVLGTMMLVLDEVDGLVSGAVHTTANTVRPALQLIKARADCKIVSSVFFMCLPEQVVVYGDCAINPDPNSEELADIAIQCAESAELFGIEPAVAMLSYSTGTSGTGSDVDKVKKATELAKAMRPDLLLDGPLQYDAAAVDSVARKKAPDSKVAGKATVFVFPDLNTGNTTYKAVQRSANVVSVGPMLQGLKKPVNDLSRGALVDDIVFTIALTAVQATRSEKGLS